jgi:hypothetical protein
MLQQAGALPANDNASCADRSSSRGLSAGLRKRIGKPLHMLPAMTCAMNDTKFRSEIAVSENTIYHSVHLQRRY